MRTSVFRREPVPHPEKWSLPLKLVKALDKVERIYERKKRRGINNTKERQRVRTEMHNNAHDV